MSDAYINLIMDIETYNDFVENEESIADYIPVSYDVSSMTNFTEFLGREGFINETFVGEDVVSENISEWVAKTLVIDGNNKFSLPTGFLDEYAEKKLKAIKNLVNGMTPQEFRKNGEFKIREAIRNTTQLVLPIGELDNGYLQTLDAWLNYNAEENKGYVIVAIYLAKG